MNMIMKPPVEGDEIEFTTVDLGDYRMRVHRRQTDCGRRPLLICNGLGQAVEMLKPLMDELHDRPLIAFDAIGAGKSTVPESCLTIQQHADLVRDMLGQMGVDEYDVLGISWGGCVAQQLAHDDPEGCRQLVLGIASAGGAVSWWGSPIAVSEILFPMRYASRAYGNLIGPWMYGGEAITTPGLYQAYAENTVKPSYQGYMFQVMAMCSWSSASWLHKITQPALVLSGLYDTLIPAGNQAFLACKIPGAELRVFPAGHLLMYSHRQEVAELIDTFLDRPR